MRSLYRKIINEASIEYLKNPCRKHKACLKVYVLLGDQCDDLTLKTKELIKHEISLRKNIS